MASFRLVRDVAAPLVDHRGYSAITSLRRSELEREGDPSPNGVGAIRVLSAVGPPMREEVLTYEEPTRFSYRVLSGLPVRDHVGTVELTPENGRTRVTYAVRTMPTLPVGGAVVVGAVKLGVKQLLAGAAREAERRAAR
jgi:Polyketide cyclase / dehydrase and lipid transport